MAIRVSIISNGETTWWERTGHFCPHCGAKSVWESFSNPDYYAGSDFVCDSCSSMFAMPFLIVGKSTTRSWVSQLKAQAVLVEDTASKSDVPAPL